MSIIGQWFTVTTQVSNTNKMKVKKLKKQNNGVSGVLRQIEKNGVTVHSIYRWLKSEGYSKKEINAYLKE